MKSSSGLVILSALVLGVTACGGAPQTDIGKEAVSVPPEQPRIVRIENVGFATPESVLHDSEADVYLISNINGSPLGADGNGFISRVAPDGNVIELKWIDGETDGVTLNAPKGMAIIGDTLYVADISFIRFFHRETGEPQGEIEIPGATFVNDLAAGRAGWLVASDSGMVFGPDGPEDTGSAAVYVISPEGELITVAAGSALEKPNGVLDSAAHDGLLVTSFGSNVVYLLDEDGARVDVVDLPNGGLDGIVETTDGRLLATSWAGSAVYSVAADGSIEVLADNLPAPADLGYDAGRDVIMVPLFNDDAVVITPARSRP